MYFTVNNSWDTGETSPKKYVYDNESFASKYSNITIAVYEKKQIVRNPRRMVFVCFVVVFYKSSRVLFESYTTPYFRRRAQTCSTRDLFVSLLRRRLARDGNPNEQMIIIALERPRCTRTDKTLLCRVRMRPARRLERKNDRSVIVSGSNHRSINRPRDLICFGRGMRVITCLSFVPTIDVLVYCTGMLFYCREISVKYFVDPFNNVVYRDLGMYALFACNRC